jgi:hypothetical protein
MARNKEKTAQSVRSQETATAEVSNAEPLFHSIVPDKAEAAWNHRRDLKMHMDNPKPDSKIGSVPNVAERTAEEGAAALRWGKLADDVTSQINSSQCVAQHRERNKDARLSERRPAFSR